VMPFGGAGAPATWNRVINMIVNDIPDCTGYFDDIIIGAYNEKDLIKTIEKVFKKLANFNLHIRTEKCQFGLTSIKFLGYKISNKGVEVDPSHINKIINFKTPTNKKQIQQFCGLINYLHKYIPHTVEHLKPF